MRDLGFSETYNLIGGILEWEGQTVDKDTPQLSFTKN
ncbi:MAG: hypothetical protein CM15mP83_6670 [Flavobacteriaceae bacterium]|nr:MAG: hypothetical protein CM15mP83_6670 [Flavobacteriaceae bacterium]